MESLDWSYLIDPATWAGSRYSVYKNFMENMTDEELKEYDEWLAQVELQSDCNQLVEKYAE